jgi:hypothetical protein
MDYHKLFGALSAAIQLLCFLPYIRDIFRQKVKPHAFTWLIWGIMSVIIFAIQISEGAGAGTWLLVVCATLSLLIAFLAVKYGTTQADRLDWVFLAACILTIPLWLWLDQAFASMLMLWAINFVAFWPTIRKAWRLPHDESVQLFFLGGVSAALAVLAVESREFLTLFYPCWLALSNFGFIAMLLFRRAKVKIA